MSPACSSHKLEQECDGTIDQRVTRAMIRPPRLFSSLGGHCNSKYIPITCVCAIQIPILQKFGKAHLLRLHADENYETKVPQQAANGPIRMLQALNPLVRTQFG